MKTKLISTLIVLMHSVVLVAHSKAHLQLQIGASAWQKVFIAIVIFIGPLFAAALLWTRFQTAGIVILASTMAGSLVFGVAYHFFVPGSDNALELHSGHWESVFRITATWLAVVETGAVAWCVWALKSDI